LTELSTLDEERGKEIAASPDLFVLGKSVFDELVRTLCSTIIAPLSISNARNQELSSLEYDEYLKTREWKAIRDFMKDAFRHCSCCGATTSLHVHHNCYPHRGAERPSDVTVLCCSCHAKIHDRIQYEKWVSGGKAGDQIRAEGGAE